MANRIQVGDPLLGATPALRPMARPIQVTPGATPAPTRSPLMELADSFNTANAELRSLLRDVAAQEEKDAAAIGEIEAQRLLAEGNIKGLDKALKAKVDAGELPPVRLPAAQRAAAIRVGHEHAEVGLRSYLDKQLSTAVASKPEEVQRIIAEATKQFGEALSPDAFYEQQAFARTSASVITEFQTRVNREQLARAEKAQRELRASELNGLLFQVATADADSIPEAAARVKASLDSIRENEIPKSEVNKVFTADAVKPALDNLILRKDWSGAKQLIHTLTELDLTGNGGLYGKTAEGSAVLREAERMVFVREREDIGLKAAELADSRQLAEEQGRKRAAEVIYKARQDNGGTLPPSIRDQLLKDSGLKDEADSVYRTRILAEFDQDAKARSNEAEAVKLLRDLDTFDTARADLKFREIETKVEAGELSAAVLAKAYEIRDNNTALYRVMTEQDFRTFNNEVFEAPGLQNTAALDVGDTTASDVWTGLPPEIRQDIRNSGLEAFRSTFAAEIRTRSEGKPENAPAIKQAAYQAAKLAAQNRVKALVTGSRATVAQVQTEKEVTEQANLIAQARRAFPGKSFLRRMLETKATADLQLASAFTKIPAAETPEETPEKADPKARLDKQRNLPPAEWDIVPLPAPIARNLARISTVRRNTVDLAAAASAVDSDNDARHYYAVAKSLAGFTPEEVKKGVTKHGVSFDPGQLDYRRVPVFRTVAELNKHWNNGEFDETFGELGDIIDPKNSMTPEQFYLAQLALLSK